jgi:hypothetical protein
MDEEDGREGGELICGKERGGKGLFKLRPGVSAADLN